MNLFIKKPLSQLLGDSEDSEKGLKRTLNSWALIALGIGAIIGAGLFARTAAAAATHAGPAVTIGYIIAGVGCAFAGLCYAEFASMIPIAGSAYTYSYATMGEFVAWIIGWDLILEYGVGAATVSSYWSQYFNKFLGIFDLSIPYQWFHSPFEHNEAGVHGIINIPAIFILLVLTLILIRGTRGSAMVNNIIVLLKVLIILIVIAIGWSHIRPENHTPYIPDPTKYTNPETGVTTNFGGIMGILGAAGIVFFAYIGFDAVSTAAQEAKNPKKSMPIGILGSLVICTILYILFSYVLTGIASTQDFRTHGKEASVTYAIEHLDGSIVNGVWHPKFGWLANLITLAILAGFSSVILVMLLGQSRVFFSMSRDGLVPKVFSDVHPKYRTPYKANYIFFIMSALFAGFIPADVVGEMTSIGTLFAFILVCAGVWIMRVRHPEIPRQFKVPALPVMSILGIVVCSAMIFGLGWTNWARLFGWLAIGLVIYFSFSYKNSRLRQGGVAKTKDPVDPLNPIR
jgi:APA family basic amino acid/polyamine antiporter